MVNFTSTHTLNTSRIIISLLTACALTVIFVFSLSFLTPANATPSDRTGLGERLAENINISVPSQINYIARADGTLITPSPNALYLKNNSNYEVRVSKVDVTASNDWSFVEDATASNVAKTASLSITPKAEAGDASELDPSSNLETITTPELTTKKTIQTTNGRQSEVPLTEAEPMWTMTAADVDGNDPNEQTSRLNFEVNGAVSTVSGANLGTSVVGSTKWYVVSDTTTEDVYDKIDALESTVATLQSENDALTNRVSQLESANANLTNSMTTAQGDISNLQSSVGNSSSGLTKQVGDLSSALGNSSSGLTKRVGDSETDISNLKDVTSRVITLPKVDYPALPSQSTNNATYFKEWLQYMAKNYSSKLRSDKVILAVVRPNMTGLVIGYSYTEINSDKLPSYSSFLYICPGSEGAVMQTFGTYNYVFYLASK